MMILSSNVILTKLKNSLKKMACQLENSYSYFLQIFSATDQRVIVVTFSGGMGAQILSAAIYFQLKSEDRDVYADFSYFQNSEHVATPGNKGEISYWGWQLQPFGLLPETFDKLDVPTRFGRRNIINDDGNKLAHAIFALGHESVRQRFLDNASIEDFIPSEMIGNYLCIHIRRGDYVNVASHLVDDQAFLELANQIHDLVNGVVVVSDSSISENFRKKIDDNFSKAIFFDDITAIDSHRIMRKARVLICSNSQFSLTAALLNPRALVLLPKQWVNEQNSKLEISINDVCGFQIMRHNFPNSRISQRYRDD